MSFDVQAAIAQAAAQGPNMTKAVKGGGGGYTPPPAGLCLATLVAYIELGTRESSFMDKGVKKTKKVKQVQLVFELAGGKAAPRVNEETGEKTPYRITVTETLSLNEKANFFKLFRKLNYDGKATHCAQLVGRHWIAEVFHTHKGEGDDKRTFANLRNADGYSFRPPVKVVGDPLDPEATVTEHPIPAPERLTDLKVFLWEFPSKPMWDSLYIDGEYPARTDDNGKEISPAKSKNVIQNKIKEALDWAESPMAEILRDGELNVDALSTNTEAPSGAAAAGDDPLAGL